MKEALLIDLSSLGHQIYHVSASEPDPDYTSKQVVARVHALAQGVEHVGICCDTGRSFRHDLTPTYKANRPAEKDAILGHQMTLIREQLARDGFTLLAAQGFEADDVIATATAHARAAGFAVTVVTADKDLLQLVTDAEPVVRCKSVQTGNTLDAEGVVQKLGVPPDQVRDYLSLVGDSSDNIKGAAGIGPKTAAEILKRFDTIDAMYANVAALGEMTAAKAASLREFKDRWPLVRQLVTLRDDVPVDVSGVLTPRPVPEMAMDEGSTGEEPMTDDERKDEDIAQAMGAVGDPSMGGDPVGYPPMAPPGVKCETLPVAQQSQAISRVVAAEVVPYERQLEPRNMHEAIILAKDMFAAKNFAGASSPQTALATIMMGREMGIGPLTALRTIHVIKGRHCMSAQLIVGQVLKSGLVEYVDPVEISDTSVTYAAKRKGRPEVRLTHTIQMAEKAGLVKADSGWEKNPTDMLVSRCSSRICRIVAPDVCATLYTPEEIREMKESDNG